MPKKILLADDSITIQKGVELTFSDGDYEVTAVNNGAKAIQKLAEMRPDIILSDIIMPEKNGYEVCEYVKSHPEYRNIPVILLTGTFEPFDPDRADKAGCDAVVTKPFESQSLIHKVEELIQQSQSSTAAAEQEPAAAVSDPFAHDNDIFAAAPPVTPAFAADMPFDAPSEDFGGETRAFSRMSFEEMQQTAAQPPAAPPPPALASEPSPWDEPQDDASTRAIPKMSFEEMRQMAEASHEQPAPFAGETRAFTRMSFEEMQQLSSTPAASPEPVWSPTADPFAEQAPEPAAEEPDWSIPAPMPEEVSEPLVNSQITDDVNPQITDVNPQTTDVNDQITDVNSQITDVNPQITDLTDEQVDRIARRVVQMMSEQVIRNIAWEVIPDLAEMVVKERIRQLEAEA